MNNLQLTDMTPDLLSYVLSTPPDAIHNEKAVEYIRNLATVCTQFEQIAENVTKIVFLNTGRIRLSQFASTNTFEKALPFIHKTSTELKVLNLTRFSSISIPKVRAACDSIEKLHLWGKEIKVSEIIAFKNLKIIYISSKSYREIERIEKSLPHLQVMYHIIFDDTFSLYI